MKMIFKHRFIKFNIFIFLLAIQIVIFSNELSAQNTLIPYSGSNSMTFNGSLCTHAGCSATYSDNAYGSTIIYAQSGKYIYITGSYYTESGFDFITIYDNNTNEQLARYEGSNSSFSFISKANQSIKILFTTDGSVTSSGLNAYVSYYTATAPGAPTNLSVSTIGTNTATLNWNAGSPAGTPNPTYYWSLYNSSNTLITSGTTTNSSVAVSSLLDNTTYYFKVYADNGLQSSTSTSSNFLTYPPAPTSISLSNTTVCSGGATTLTANGVVGTVYWYSGSCGGTLLGTGNSITVNPTSTSVYYAKNYNSNGVFSVTCATKSVLVLSNNTVTLSSGIGSNQPTTCISSSINSITYTTTGATGATFSGLPTGVTGVWSSNAVTISGTPTVSGTFPYTVSLTGGCGVASATGTITVNPVSTYALTSPIGTNSQTICNNSAIADITYSTTGATGATFSGLPTGVTGSWSNNNITISGTATSSGNYTYTIALVGACGSIMGNIYVTPVNSITLSSSSPSVNQIVCASTAITNITYTTTGISLPTVTNLPAGVNSSWLNNVLTISGTPTAAGIFNYTINQTGTCGSATTTGTITVNSASVASVTGSDALCIGATGTYTATNVILSGGTGSWSSSNTAIATVNATTGLVTGITAGTATITYTITGGCGGTITKSKLITINAKPTLAAIGGSTTVCNIGGTATLTNATIGGIWSSSNTAIATINSVGVVSGVAYGNATITYTFTDNNSCTNSVTTPITVASLPATPTSLTATPATLCNAGTTILKATSTGNLINWYSVSSGGSALGSVASGTNFTTGTISNTTTFYAEAAYSSSTTFNHTGALQTYTVPDGVTTITIDAYGAQGGNNTTASFSGGYGARAKTTLSVTPGQVLSILVGAKGGDYGSGAGGGGGSFVVNASNAALVVAGGGGGAFYCSAYGGVNGGSGLITTSGGNGIPGPSNRPVHIGGTNGNGGTAYFGGGGGGFLTNGVATYTAANAGNKYPGAQVTGGGGVGGYGGGGAGYAYSCGAAGGGGGYSGGSSGTSDGTAGGGGGSFIVNTGTNNLQTAGANAGNGYVVITTSSASNPCVSPRVPIVVSMSTAASVASVTGSDALCIAATGTYSASSVILAGGTGAWSSSNTAVATVNATTGIVTAVSAGTANIKYTITGGCGGTVFAQKTITVNALPTVAAIAGSTTVCNIAGTVSLTNATTGGVWSSTNTSIATIDNNGLVTGVAFGNASITYTVTNGNGCVKQVNTIVTVNTLPTIPASLTATPATICTGGTTVLNAVSAGNTINWYSAATGGTALSSVASGANYTTTAITTTKTFYAEAAFNNKQTFNYTGAVQDFVVPSGVTSIIVEAWGAQGGRGWINGGIGSGLGGNGGYAKGTLAVTPGETLKLYIGGRGGSAAAYSSGGWNGGGSSDDTDTDNDDSGGGGGGASDIRKGGTALSNRVIVAGGGGGGGCASGNGGAGGGLNGITGFGTTGGVAGTQSTGASVGYGENVTTATAGSGGVTGAGGGGYYGGYGGRSSYSTGGGGGSAYIGGVTNASTIAGNASMPNPAGGTNITGKEGDGIVVLTFASNPCVSPRVPIVVNLATSASVTSVTGNATICIGATGTYTATSVVLAGGTGAWSSSNTAVATVNASTGVVTSVSAGTANIIYTISGGCGGTVSAQKSITVKALPSVANITGSSAVCGIGSTVSLSNATIGGVWTSTNAAIATITNDGLVTGVGFGTANMIYTVTDVNSCTNSSTINVLISTLPATPTNVTSTPATLCAGGTSVLNAISSGNVINWYEVATGGSILSTTASGGNYTTTAINATKTFYAEAAYNSVQTFNYTGSVQSLVVPSGVTSMSVEAWGAAGGRNTTNASLLGAKAGYAKGVVAVTPGETIYFYVGGKGANSTTSADVCSTCERAGGFNGGGKGINGGAGGGGATDIRRGGSALSNRVLVAAGAGGAGYQNGAYAGGYGGGTTGGAGAGSGAALAGTQNSGYALGVGGPYNSTNDCGGGGGGYYGGNGGFTSNSSGAGGSSYIGGVTSGQTIAGNASMPNPTGGANITGWDGDGIVRVTFGTSPCISPRVPVVVSLAETASVGSITGAATVCVGATTTYTATSVVLAGGNGSWTSSNTAVATVNASTGIVSSVSAGTATITYTIAGGCGGTVSKQKMITVAALPVLGAISGIESICKDATTTFTNATTGGVWSSSNNLIATISNSGLITGVASGNASITYTFINVNGCSSTISKVINIAPLPDDPTSVTATPSTLLSGATTSLSAVSSGNKMYWYDVATGGTPLAIINSGATFTRTVDYTTTYYVEAKTQSELAFTYTGAQQAWVVPSGVTSIEIKTWGAQGGGAQTGIGGKGGYATGTLLVTPGETLYINVGGKGNAGTTNVQVNGGFNGGGYARAYTSGAYAASGGGATDIRKGGTALANRVIVAGGGGGTGFYSSIAYAGGVGGGTSGTAGTNYSSYTGGSGGSQLGGGAKGANSAYSQDGTMGNGGNSTATSGNWNGSAGGGGYYGGGSGGAVGAGGGGGSSYIGGVIAGSTIAGNASMPSPLSSSNITGNTGDGYVKFILGGNTCNSMNRIPIVVTVANMSSVTTSSVSSIGLTAAVSGGEITNDGGSSIIARGVCWSTSSNPTIANSKTVNGNGSGIFTSSITGLNTGTTYYIRAYATNAIGTTYGLQYSFTTLAVPTITSFTPTTAGKEVPVVITGTNYVGVTSVQFGGTNAASFTVNSSTQITALPASGASGDITVTTAGGTATKAGFTYQVPPSTQASIVTFSGITNTQTTIGWTNGNGTKRVVFVKAGTSSNAAPVNGTTYTANTNFGSGTQIGTSGWFVVYNGTGSSVNVTGLTPMSSYRVMVLEYNGVAGSEVYYSNTYSSNPNNVTTLGPTITTNTNTINQIAACNGTPSSTQTFTVGGQYLTANLVIDAPTGFEISTNSNSGFATSLSLTPISGTISSTVVYVRTTSVSSGTISGTLSLTSIDANTKSVALSALVYDLSVAGVINGNTSVCVGANNTTLTLSGYTGNIQWQSSLDNQNYSTISNAISTSLSLSNLTTTAYYRAVVTNGVCVSSNTIEHKIDVNPNPTSGVMTLSAPTGAICSGTNISATLTTPGTGGAGTITDVIQYQYDGGVWISYTSNTSLSTSGHTSLAIRTFRTANGSACSAAIPNVYNWTINESPSIAAQPSTTVQNLCQNTNAVGFTVSAAGAGLTYQWYKNNNSSNTGGTIITGATSASYTPTTTDAGTNYYYVVVSGTCSPSVTSNVSGAINVKALPTITAQPSTTSQALCLNATASELSVTATGTSINYQWYKNTSNATSEGVLILGATSNTYRPLTNSIGTSYYYVKVSGACSPEVVSASSGAIVVNPIPVVQITQGNALSLGAAGTIELSANSTGGTPNYTYQWFKAGVEVSSAPSALNSYNERFNVNSIGSYTVKVTDNQSCTAFSQLTNIQALPTLSVAGSNEICEGGTVEFIFDASALDPNALVWETSTDNLDWYPIQNALIQGGGTATIQKYTAIQTGYYRVAYTSGGSTTYSSASNVTIFANPIAVINSDVSLVNLCANTPLTFTASVTSGVDTYTYQWTKNGASLGTSDQLSVNADGTYKVKITDSHGCFGEINTSPVIFNPLPNALIDGTTVVCEDAPTPSLQLIGSSGTSPYTFTYDINGGADINTSYGSITVPTSDPGTFVYNLKGITDAIGCYQSVTDDATIVVNPLPTITLSGIEPISRTATSVVIPFVNTTNVPTAYSIAAGNRALSNFNNVISSSLTSSPINMVIPQSVAGIYDFNLKVLNAQTGCSSLVQPFELTINAPSVNTSGTLSNLSTDYGTPSSSTNLVVSGTYVMDDLIITAPAGFEIATASNPVYSNQVLLSPETEIVSYTAINIRLKSNTPVAGSPYTGNLTISSNGINTIQVPVPSSVVSAVPVTVTGISVNDKFYDGNRNATIAGTPVYNGLMNAEQFNVTGTPIALFDSETAGNNKSISINGYTAPNTNYYIQQPNNLTATIQKLTLTVAANTVNVQEGATVQSLIDNASSAITGFVNAENASVISGTTTYTTNYTSNAIVGTTGLVLSPDVSGLSANNYDFTAVDAAVGVVINPTSYITVTGINNLVYNGLGQGPSDANVIGSTGQVTYSYSGRSGTNYGPSSIKPVNVGTYQVVANVASDNIYNAATSLPYQFEIAKKPLNLRVRNQTVNYGLAVNTIIANASFDYEGLVSNDNVNSISGVVTYSTNYTTTSLVGAQNIVLTPNISALGTNNYLITAYEGNINIVDIAPAISYPQSSYTFTKNTSITQVVPVLNGTNLILSIDSLPAGLNFNTINGQITGTPTITNTSATNYVVTVRNGTATVTSTLSIIILPDQPQGSIGLVNRNLLKSDSVSIQFNFTQGIAPYNAIVQNLVSNKYDTLIGLVDGSIRKLAPIERSTIYKLIQLSDANNTFRNTAFDNDTAVLSILKPSMVLQLSATVPVLTSSGNYDLVLKLRIKNSGQVNLSNLQIDADLSKLFAAGFQYKLDSILVSNNRLRLNPNFTGLGISNAFSSVLNTTTSKQGYIKSMSTLYGNYLFDNNVSLTVGDEAEIKIKLTIPKSDIAIPVALQFSYTALANLQLTDNSTSTQVVGALSHDASPKEDNIQPNPVQTIVSLFPNPNMGSSLQVSAARAVSGGYEFHFVGKLANLGNTNLDSIDVFYNIADVFKSPDVAYLKNPPTITRGNLVYNNQYDGVNNTLLLHQSNNLQLGDSVSFEFDIVVNTTKISSTWLNQLTAKSYSTLDRIAITDTSVDGLKFDPNKDGLGYESSFTRATLNYTYPVAPVVENLSFVYGTTPVKTTRGLIQSYPTATIPVWCDVVTAKCDTIAPSMPIAIGQYIYELRSFDPVSNLYSIEPSYDTIIVKPTLPIVKNRIYIIGLSTNPADIGAQVVGLSNSSIRYYLQNTLQNTTPVMLNAPATIIYAVSQVVNGVESDKTNLTLQYLTTNEVVHLQKIAASSKVLPNGVFEVNYQFVIQNLINDTLTSISIKDDLSSQLPIGVTSNLSSIRAMNQLQVNNQYNGQSNLDLLQSTSFILPKGYDTVYLQLYLDAGAYAGLISNQANLSIATPYGVVAMNSSDKTKALETSKMPTVFTLPILSIKIAEGFSPNNDGIDDKWVIIKPYGTRISVRVFNRWGSEVYGNNNYQNDWDGRADKQLMGDILPEGTYYYVVESFDRNGGQQKFNGSLTIVK